MYRITDKFVNLTRAIVIILIVQRLRVIRDVSYMRVLYFILVLTFIIMTI